MALFSTTGIRGISNQDMNPEFALLLAKTFGTFLGGKGTILVARDTRTSSKMLKNSVVAGLLSTGMNVVNAGVIPIPVVTYSAKKDFDAGMMITSSHNPPEYNGIKFILPTGSEIADEDELKFEEILNSSEFKKAPWSEIGKYQEKDILESYIKAVTNAVNKEKIASAKLKIAIDTANGAQSILMPRLLKELGCEVFELNTKPSGIFARDPEPTTESLKKLEDLVLKKKADLGVGFDTDGDRAIFVTNKGKTIMGDVSGTILAIDVMKNKKGKIVTPVNSSRIIDDMAAELKGEIVKTKIGAKRIADTMHKEKAIFGFEENGGCIFSEFNLARDAALAALKMLDLIASKGKSLSELAEELPVYYQLKTKIECSDSRKSMVMQKLEQNLKENELVTLDGIKVIFKDGSTIIRASGTEPYIRIFSEAKSKPRAKELMDWSKKELEKAL